MYSSVCIFAIMKGVCRDDHSFSFKMCISFQYLQQVPVIYNFQNTIQTHMELKCLHCFVKKNLSLFNLRILRVFYLSSQISQKPFVPCSVFMIMLRLCATPGLFVLTDFAPRIHFQPNLTDIRGRGHY